MPIDRKLWLRSFVKNQIPNWHCPRCAKGILRPLDKSFRCEETADSRLANATLYAKLLELEGKTYSFSENQSTIDSEFSSYCYLVILKCNNPSCFEYVVSCGVGYMEEFFNIENDDISYSEVFQPEYFYPPINIFTIPQQCPEHVAKEIRSSFKLFFADPPASANYVRKAVDAILTSKKVKRFAVTSKGKKIAVNLHERIVEFEKNKPDIAKKLFAIKWLGNEGSHTDKITKNDVLYAYEILESVIDELYVGYGKLLEKKVLRINKIKKPLHPST
jgi:hypothetical protein